MRERGSSQGCAPWPLTMGNGQQHTDNTVIIRALSCSVIFSGLTNSRSISNLQAIDMSDVLHYSVVSWLDSVESEG
jgi:hypothetical protein